MFVLVFYFIFGRERESARVREHTEVGEGQRDRETQNPKQLQAPRAVSTGHDAGPELTNCEIMT